MSPFTPLAIVALSNARSLLIRRLRSPSRIGIRSENSCSRSFLRFKVPMALPFGLPDLPSIGSTIENRCRSHLGMALTELIEGFPCDGVYGILASSLLPPADRDLDIAGVE